MAEYKVVAVSPGAHSAMIDKDGDVIDISAPDVGNRSLDFNFSGDILTITDLWDDSYRLVYDLSNASRSSGMVFPL